jgi:hypothetical protein
VYRAEGTPSIARAPSAGGGTITFRGKGGLVHAAQYRHATLRVALSVAEGSPEIAFSHNGLFDNRGTANPEPGFKVVFSETSTEVIDIANGLIVASLDEVLPRFSPVTISVAWDVDAKTVRLDLPQRSYALTLKTDLPVGGFALRSTDERTSFQVKQIGVLFQDDRRVVLYDEYDSLYDESGALLGKVPSAKLPVGMTAYGTAAVDLRKARALVFYGGPDLNIDFPATVKGFAVRDLKTGGLDLFPAPLNGCMPLQGGGGVDGHALLQSWVTPASLCWLDWNAYDRGDRTAFVVPSIYRATGSLPGPFVGFHDSDSALDGSVTRYVRITETYKGILHFSVHPNLLRWASFSDKAIPPDVEVSHTSPYGLPTQLAVRDRDRGFYEVWAYGAPFHGLHVQCRGYNLFANADDWAGPRYPTSTTAAPYTDYANMVPNLLRPGAAIAPLIRWTPSNGSVAAQSLHHVTVTPSGFAPTGTLPSMPVATHPPISILWD